jgi:hypothetical protein
MMTPTADGVLNIGRASSYHVTIDGDEIQSKNNINPNNLFLNNFGGDIVMDGYGGSVGIGVYGPSEKLSVDGTIESVKGGFKFPDGSVQTRAHSTTENESIELAGHHQGPFHVFPYAFCF